MRRIFNLIYLPVLLLALWLLLNDSLSLGNIFFGSVLAITLSLLAPLLRPVRASISKPITAIKLIIKVAIDISISNYNVGLLIIQRGPLQNNPGMVQIPLKIIDSHALAALSCIITFTPGTVWAGHNPETNILTLHVLDRQDEAKLISHIQTYYEQPLAEIFQ